MNETVLIGAAPLLLVTLIRLLAARRPHRPTGALREVRDLVTLRMVLRDSLPGERGVLLDAHRDWRVATGVPAPSPGHDPGPSGSADAAGPGRPAGPGR
ncbi:hypothetical protein ABZ467_36520 [Streptomyces sp. NPDC005727]|uniref:hypothetical protein n=1 Tax=Streptomyces sp. NPDC005727 TaxID=3157053 RepID=UPI0033CC25C4